MKNNFFVGNRIKISENYHWARGATGVIIKPPNYIVEMSDGWADHIREVKSLKGILFFYWVRFDEPQIDADGDDYQEAEINSSYLVLN